MLGCQNCEVLPLALPEAGTLFLCPPLGHTLDKLRRLLAARSLIYTEPAPQMLAVSMQAGGQALLAIDAEQHFSVAELADTRCLILPEGAPLTLGDLAQTTTFLELLARRDGAWLVQVLANEQLGTAFQPIFATDQLTTPFGHECLLRGFDGDGAVIAPLRLYAVARASHMLFQLDRAARLQHIRAAVVEKLASHIFINFNPTAIYDPVYCLRTTIAAISAAAIPPGNFVFEVVESDRVDAHDQLLRILDYYRGAGFRVALDDVGAGYASLNLLSTLRPDFAKIDMELIRNVDQDPYKARITAKLLELAHSLGIKSIVEGVETAAELQWAVENGADYVQGYLLGRPSATIAARSTAPVPLPLPGDTGLVTAAAPLAR